MERPSLTTPRTRYEAIRRIRTRETVPSTEGEFSHVRTGEWNEALKKGSIENYMTGPMNNIQPSRQFGSAYLATESCASMGDLCPDLVSGRAKITHINGTNVSVKTVGGLDRVL